MVNRHFVKDERKKITIAISMRPIITLFHPFSYNQIGIKMKKITNYGFCIKVCYLTAIETPNDMENNS